MTKRILVVEDQADLRGILRDLLTGSGYEVAEAADGGEGVASGLYYLKRVVASRREH